MIPRAAFLADAELDLSAVEDACERALSIIDSQRARLAAEMPDMEVAAEMRRAESGLLWGVFDELLDGSPDAICAALAMFLHRERRMPIDRAQAAAQSISKTVMDRRDAAFLAVVQSGRDAARYGVDGGLVKAARLLDRSTPRAE